MSRNGKVEIVGAIFPVPSEIASDMFERRKNIFAKFTKMKKLKPGHRILFYASHGIKGIIGEAQVEGGGVSNSERNTGKICGKALS